MTGFVYIWRDKKHNRYYIGSHWGTPDDGYICSSPWMKAAYKRRPSDFKRRLLTKDIDNRTELREQEQYWFDKIKPNEIGKRYYNLTTIVKFHWSTDPNRLLTIGQKISKSNKGKPGWNKGGTHTKEAVLKIKEKRAKQRPPTLGLTFSDEHKKKISESNSGINSSQYGRIYTEEERKKKSKETKGVPKGPFSDEHKRKMSEAAKARWRKQK